MTLTRLYLHLQPMALTLSDLAPALKNHLWQSTLFLIAAALLTLALRHNHARTRYWLWLTASIKFLIPFSLLITLGSHLATPRPVPPTQTTVYFAMEEVSQPFAPIDIPIAAPTPLAKHPTHILPIVLAAVWFAGFTTVLTIWFVYWRRITAILRASTPIHEGRELEILRRLESTFATPYSLFPTPSRIQLLASPSTLGPGIYGIARPILLWPAAISQRLDDAHLESIFAHEICHVSRRDNLTAALHMLVEAIFWFHPLVWALGARLEAERERACDESVLENSPTLTTRPHVYAESIVKICEFYVESPLPCVSGVTGADLKKRLTDILERHATLKLTLAKKLLLAIIGLTFITIPILSGHAKAMQRLTSLIETAPRRIIPASFIAPAATGQATDAKADSQEEATLEPLGPSFEVASIRPTGSGDRHWIGFSLSPSGRLTASAVSVKSLVGFSYIARAGSSQVFGGPGWAESDNFDISAKVDESQMAGWDKLSDAQRIEKVKPMIRALLAERFHLKLHTEMRVTPVDVLVQTKGGAKLKEVAPPPPTATSPEGKARADADNAAGKAPVGGFRIAGGTWTGNACPMSTLAANIEGNSGNNRVVIDQTGLKGYYDFTLNQSMDKDGPTFEQQIEDQLGLKLEPRKLPIKTYIIDSVDKPSIDGAELPPTITEKYSRYAEWGNGQAITVDTPPVFEVATIKPTDESPGVMHMVSPQVFPGGRIIINGHTLKGLISIAFHIGYYQISGGEDWMGKTRFDIEAKPSEEWQKKITNINHSNFYIEDENLCRMLQALLIDRFQLKVHVETKTGKVFLLEQNGKGANLQPTKATATNHPGAPEGFGGDIGRASNRFSLYNTSMPQLAKFTADYILHQPVIDHTGLTGSFDHRWEMDNPDDPEGRNFDFAGNFPLFLQEMGLKLTPSTGPVESLVIDHAEKPTPN